MVPSFKLLCWLGFWFGSLQVHDFSRDVEEVSPIIKRVRHSIDATNGTRIPEFLLPEDNSTSLLLVVIRTKNHTHYLELSPVNDVLWTNLSSPWVNASQSCLYRGEVISHPPGHAAVSFCKGQQHMYGMWSSPDGHYVLRPSLNPNGNFTHDLRKLNSTYGNERIGSCTSRRIPDGGKVRDPPPLWTPPNNPMLDVPASPEPSALRQRRQLSSDGPKYVETAIFGDKTLWKRFQDKYQDNAEEQLTNFILAVVNEVQTLYKYQSMQSNINIVVQKIILLKDGDPAPDTAGGEITGYLDSFCTWQSTMKNRTWDHAIMVTGLNLYMGRPSNDMVIGEAWVEGMCTPKYSCTVNEADDFEASFVIAHEMGHSFSMVHDGTGNSCDSTKFIMSPTTGPGKIQWSTCSNGALKIFLQNIQAKCLNNVASTIPTLDYAKPGLPGERYPLTAQCKLAKGENYLSYITKSPPFNDPCREAWCYNPRSSLAYSTHPALEGSSCGDGGQPRPATQLPCPTETNPSQPCLTSQLFTRNPPQSGDPLAVIASEKQRKGNMADDSDLTVRVPDSAPSAGKDSSISSQLSSVLNNRNRFLHIFVSSTVVILNIIFCI